MEPVPTDIKRSVWLRDDFSCKVCGRTLGWEELNIGFVGKDEGQDSMIALCSDCVTSDNKPLDPRYSRLLSALRDIECQEMELDGECGKDPAKLEVEVARLESENRSLREEGDKRLRVLVAYKNKAEQAQSDYMNLKARTEREVSSKVNLALRGLLLGTISSIDDLDRSISALSDQDRIGVEAVKRNMIRTLEDAGVVVMDPTGGRFDPNLCEAVEVRYLDGEDNRILQVHSPGYVLDGKVLRPAKVTVGRSPQVLEEFEIIEEDEDEFEVQRAIGKKAAIPKKTKRKRSKDVRN